MKIKVTNLHQFFNKNSSLELEVLKGVNVDLTKGEMISIIGPSGAGKTTFIEHLNGLLIPAKGKIDYFDFKIAQKFSFAKLKKKENIPIIVDEKFFAQGKEKLWEIFQNFNFVIQLDFSVWNPQKEVLNFFINQKKILEKTVNFQKKQEINYLLNYYEIKNKFLDCFLFFLLANFAESQAKIIFNLKNIDKETKKKLLNICNFYSLNFFFSNKEINAKNFSFFIKKKLVFVTSYLLENKKTINSKAKKVWFVKSLRKQIGIVFQFAEYQLFKSTCQDDIMFGPLSMGVSKAKAEFLAKKYISVVGLDESFLLRDPFQLSGGQKRRIAIAGILAMEPDFLIFDEPTAGLDPQGVNDILDLFKAINNEGKSILICTHEMDNALKYTKRTLVFHEGKLVRDDNTYEVLSDFDFLEKYQIYPPKILLLAKKISSKTNWIFDKIFSKKDLIDQVNQRIKKTHDN